MLFKKTTLITITIFLLSGCQSESKSKHAGSLEIGKEQVVEICSEMSKGQSLELRYKANIPVNFNLHYHDAETVIPLIPKQSLPTFKHTITLKSLQEYCLMWTGLSSGTSIIYEYAYH
jgi:uncharacterized protein YcfL